MLSEYCSVSKTAVWKWVVKLRDELQTASKRVARRFIAVDGTCGCAVTPRVGFEPTAYRLTASPF